MWPPPRLKPGGVDEMFSRAAQSKCRAPNLDTASGTHGRQTDKTTDTDTDGCRESLAFELRISPIQPQERSWPSRGTASLPA